MRILPLDCATRRLTVDPAAVPPPVRWWLRKRRDWRRGVARIGLMHVAQPPACRLMRTHHRHFATFPTIAAANTNIAITLRTLGYIFIVKPNITWSICHLKFSLGIQNR